MSLPTLHWVKDPSDTCPGHTVLSHTWPGVAGLQSHLPKTALTNCINKLGLRGRSSLLGLFSEISLF